MLHHSPVKKITSKAVTKVNDLLSSANYGLNQVKHLKNLPPLSPIGNKIVQEINQEGVSVVSLEQLGFLSNPALLKSMEMAVKDLDELSARKKCSLEYNSGFEHCIPINPRQIATRYPELFLWGLDESLLDIIENCIGLPIAYHGVIVRKEIVDGQQIGSRVWHTDHEDVNIIRVSIYLTDVLDDEAGPFEYIPRSSSPSYRDFKGVASITDEEMHKVVPSSQWKACKGAAGTVIFGAVSKVFHHGKTPLKERVAASFFYTSTSPTNEKLCREYSFQSGIPLITAPLTERQRQCLWKYQDLLPSNLS